ncbi:MAG: RluA family pseudouridine synthase [Gammaproteobacteria bacterium]|jgi:23S rRNA pseudouridine955/2504/2580 synthase|tara:strand:+ start:15115 stop:16023 length:909 start_codon:yes stop_codon:yes gene_type:complete
MSEINFFIVNKDNDGRRLDNYLFSQFKKGIPKSKIYSSVRKAKIKVNGKKAKPDQKVKDGDKVTYPLLVQKSNISDSPNLQEHLNLIKNSILYDSKNFIVINKPPNYAVHGGSGLNFGIIEIVRKLYKYSENFNLAHRLDKSTSGCLIISKKMSSLRDIHKQFRERSIKKIYQCIVLGEWPHDLKKVKNKLDTKKVDKKEQKTFRSDSGKESLTTFKIEKQFDKFTQLIAMPHTGRTHQIRFHCYDSGYPIIGDRKYSNDMSKTLSKRLMLHAKQIEFQDNGEKIIISTDDDYGLSDFKKST